MLGEELLQTGKVSGLEINQKEMRITSQIAGKQRNEATIQFAHLPSGLFVSHRCPCHSQYLCEHLYAMLQAAILELGKSQTDTEKAETLIDEELRVWTQALKNAESPQEGMRNNAVKKSMIAYELSQQNNSLVLCWLKVTGRKQSKVSVYDLFFNSAIQDEIELCECDWEIFFKLTRLQLPLKKKYYPHEGFTLLKESAWSVIELLMPTGQLFWRQKEMAAPYTFGPPLFFELEWNYSESKETHELAVKKSRSQTFITKGPVPFYIDHTARQIGVLTSKLGEEDFKLLLQLPPIKNEQLSAFKKILETNAPKLATMLPNAIEMDTVTVAPVPLLELHLPGLSSGDPEWGNFKLSDKGVIGKVRFIYGGEELPYDPKQEAVHVFLKEKKYKKIIRNEHDEAAACTQLKEMGWERLPYIEPIYGMGKNCPIGSTLLTLTNTTIPELEKRGWKITFDKNFPYTKVHKGEELYLSSNTQGGWLDLSLGVLIDGKRFNLLPLLKKAHQSKEENKENAFLEALEKAPDDYLLPLPTKEGELIAIAVGRLRPIFKLLAADFTLISEEGELKVSKWNAMMLAELARADTAAKMRWLGDQSLIQFAEKLLDCQGTGLPEGPLAQNFCCELRPYQREGVSWLQLLRDNGLNGILADDMGLGKTIQTLAHIQIEKESGRLQSPALIIAPTSLMNNWREEAHRFAPDLKVLILQGVQRKQHFQAIKQHDLILSTYPLMMRDKEMLLTHQFHLLILDEAQAIKNPETQAYQVIQQISAHQRICLTGTPMENHLGELWSLFNFLLPGLLGDKKSFYKNYRLPIEKEGSQARSLYLSQRIKPFILRRTKQLVVKELPPKTEIVQKLEMEKGQRDFYEAIRLKAHQELMALIKVKGLAKSQIALLDALLKLRQACCDPRLVKIDYNISGAQSAKLIHLMEMVPQMLAVGRKILLFSQFTSMLALMFF